MSKLNILGLLLSSTVLTAAASGPAMAELAVSDEIVTTATRTAQPLGRVGSSVSVITAAEMERRQYSFVHEALATVPGLTVSQNGAFGGVASVRIRGALSEQTLVLLDGVQVNDPSSPGGGFNFATLDPNDIARIEVLRGPQSTLYGSNAIGGVINIITKKGGQGLGINAFAEGGSYATFRGGVTASGADERFDYRLSASGITSDGISKADSRDGNSERDGHDNITLSSNVGMKVVDGFRLEGGVHYSGSRTEYDGWGPVTGVADSDDYTKSKELTVHGRALVTLYDGAFENSVAVAYNDITRDNFTNGLPSFAAEGSRLAFSYQGNVRLAEGTILTAGAETAEEKIATATENAAITTSSVYAQAQVLVLDALTVTGGVRYDNHEEFGGVTTFRATAAYPLAATGTTFRASWGEGFKAPTPFQLTFFCCGVGGPNLALKPEQSKGWDVGVEQAFFGDKVRASVTYFHQNTDNLIDFDIGNYRNIDKTRARGVEVGLMLAPVTWFTVDANYTHTAAIDRLTGLDLAFLPKNKASVTVTVHPVERLTLSVGALYRGERVDSYGAVDDWLRVDLRAAYKLTESLDLYGRIDNLFDAKYQEVFGYGTPGVSGHAGVRARF